jgi:ankyrin repeat protein
MLIERGADVTAQDEDGDTPLHQASTPYWSKPSQKYAEIARMLLDHGADVNAQNKRGWNPLSPFR